jgi:Enoyl-CoA hydratase/isomerase
MVTARDRGRALRRLAWCQAQVLKGFKVAFSAKSTHGAKIGAATARMIGADETQRIGLVNRVVPAPEVMASALETAEVIAANRPSAVQAVKHQVSATLAEHARSREALEQELGDRVHASAHFREGVEAFRTKRQPRYDSAGAAPLGLLDPGLQRLHLDACLVHRSRVRHGGRSGGIDQVDSKFPRSTP